MTALARELLGFMWAIAVHTEAQFKLTKAAPSDLEISNDSSADNGRGHAEKENPRGELCGTVSGPNPRFQSEAKLPTDHVPMRFRPAYISVINRRAQLPGSYRHCCRSEKPLRAQASSERVPPCAAHRFRARCRTVLAGKGSLRRALKSGAPLPAPRRSGQNNLAMGGSGREHSGVL